MNLTLTATITTTVKIDEGLVLESWIEYLEDNPGVPENVELWLDNYLSNDLPFSENIGCYNSCGYPLDLPWECDEEDFETTKKALKDYILKNWKKS